MNAPVGKTRKRASDNVYLMKQGIVSAVCRGTKTDARNEVNVGLVSLYHTTWRPAICVIRSLKDDNRRRRRG